jgi:hypothetical protein
MQAKNEPGGRHRIAHLLSRAFREAEAGDRESAMAYWHQAILEGYEPKVKTKKHLVFTLRQAENQAAVQYGKEHGIKTGVPDGEMSGEWMNNTTPGLAARIIAARRRPESTANEPHAEGKTGGEWADVILSPEKAERIVREFEKNCQVGDVYPGTEFPGEHKA